MLFSAILNTNSKIADLLLNSKGTFAFLAPDFLQTELRKYHSKISKMSMLSISEIEKIENKITKPIDFMSGIHIPEIKWTLAENMVKDIDIKDTPYVAFSLFYKCKIWSGEKVLHSKLIQTRNRMKPTTSNWIVPKQKLKSDGFPNGISKPRLNPLSTGTKPSLPVKTSVQKLKNKLWITSCNSCNPY